MPVTSSDIKIYGAQNIAESGGVTQGGPINTAVRYVMDLPDLFNDPTASGGDGTLTAVSDYGSDTQNLTVTGRQSAGVIVSETVALNGATPVSINTNTYERLLKIDTADTSHGNVSVKDSAGYTVVTIESGVSQVRGLFYDVSADASGGSSRDFYEKVFVKNTNSVNALLSPVVSEQADPSALIDFTLEASGNGGVSMSTRLDEVPEGISEAFSSTAKNVPGDLMPGSGIGVYIRLTLPAGQAAAKSSYTIRTTGSTT